MTITIDDLRGEDGGKLPAPPGGRLEYHVMTEYVRALCLELSRMQSEIDTLKEQRGHP